MRDSYPVTHFTAGRIFRWFVASRYPDGVVRHEAGPFWRFLTAERLKGEFVRNYRNGFDMGESGKYAYGKHEPAYGEWCRNPAACAGKGYCPLDPTCGD